MFSRLGMDCTLLLVEIFRKWNNLNCSHSIKVVRNETRLLFFFGLFCFLFHVISYLQRSTHFNSIYSLALIERCFLSLFDLFVYCGNHYPLNERTMVDGADLVLRGQIEFSTWNGFLDLFDNNMKKIIKNC